MYCVTAGFRSQIARARAPQVDSRLDGVRLDGRELVVAERGGCRGSKVLVQLLGGEGQRGFDEGLDEGFEDFDAICVISFRDEASERPDQR